MEKILLEINALTCGYGNKIVLNGINLTVNEGEIIGIIGPNGSGKTTLIRALTKLIKPVKGEILLERRNIWEMDYKQLSRKVSVVSQQIESVSMSVEDFVLLGRLPYYKRFQFIEAKEDIAIAYRCMELTDTITFRDRSMEEMSGGERQLVFIAKALAQEPKLLLLDEPTSHLDITHQIKVLDMVKRLNRDFHLTVIMVLHDLNLAGEYSQRLAMFNNGQVYKTGTPEEVLQYQAIEDVYKTIVVVEKNPISNKPFVLIVPEEARRNSKGKNKFDKFLRGL
ncbi:MAG: ABC transporter ATP-binding protein [Candidatus Omnitrophica bacterium]|nr:ABC transporter ATP-binding protein [Candidatus Omnitrophota bacterium]